MHPTIEINVVNFCVCGDENPTHTQVLTAATITEKTVQMTTAKLIECINNEQSR